MIPYILHVTVITTACFLFYKLFLQKETFYKLNRWTLLGCLAVSFTLPLLPVPGNWSWRESWTARSAQPVAPPVVERTEPGQKKIAMNEAEPTVSEPVTPVRPVKQRHQATRARAMQRTKQQAAVKPAVAQRSAVQTPVCAEKPASGATPADGAGWMDKAIVALQWLFYLYLFGVIVFGGNFLLQLAVMLYQSYARPVVRDGRFRIVEINGNRAPCSFGNTIFINPANYDWETYNQILIHEKVHVSGRHTLDIVLAELAVVCQWFNPFVWLYRREVENNLEFLTDASVLEHREVERSAYQLSLLRVSAPHLPFSITNNYNQSLLKRRIVMMNSKRSSLHTVWKYFFLIPLLTGLVCALNKPAAFGAGSKNGLSAADGGSRLTDEKTIPVSLLKTPALWMAAMSGFADTGKKPKPRTDSGWWSHNDSLTEDAAPVIAFDQDSLITPQMMMSLDQARQSVLASAKEMALSADEMALSKNQLNEQMNQAMLAQTDMANRGMVLTQQQKTLVDMHTQLKVNVSVAPVVTPMINMDLDLNLRDIHIEGDTDLLEGAWFATSFSSDGKIQFDLKRENENGSWNNSFSVDKSEFNPFPGQGNVEFKLSREAGTITFKGQFDGQEGFGHFRFTPDDAYFKSLQQLGIEDMENRRFAFFTVNIKKDYAGMLLHTFPHLTMRELISCAANHIDAEFIKYWQGSGLTDIDNPRSFITLKSMHIDHAYVDELKAAGYDHLTLRELVSLKSMHVDGAYIRDLKAAGCDHLEVRELVSLKSQHIDGAYIKSLGRNKDNTALPVRDIISYKSMHIDSSYIASLRGVGYSDLDRNELFSLYSQHISAAFIKGFQDVGYKELSVRNLVNLKAMGITPEYVKGFRDIGYKDADLRQLNSFKSQNVTPEFIKGWRDLGYEDITANQLSNLKAMGVTPDFVKEFNKIGFDHIPVNTLVVLKSTGVNAEYVTKMKEKGFVSKDLTRYVRLKNDFN